MLISKKIREIWKQMLHKLLQSQGSSKLYTDNFYMCMCVSICRFLNIYEIPKGISTETGKRTDTSLLESMDNNLAYGSFKSLILHNLTIEKTVCFLVLSIMLSFFFFLGFF